MSGVNLIQGGGGTSLRPEVSARRPRSAEADSMDFESLLLSTLLAAVPRPPENPIPLLAGPGNDAGDSNAEAPPADHRAGDTTTKPVVASPVTNGHAPEERSLDEPSLDRPVHAGTPATESEPILIPNRPVAPPVVPAPDPRTIAITPPLRPTPPVSETTTEPVRDGSNGSVGKVGGGRSAGANSTRPDPDKLADAWVARFKRLDSRPVTGKSTFVLPLEAGDESSGMVRLSLRGRSLTATILATDREVQQQLSSSLGELRDALLARGFAEARLRVSGMRTGTRSGERRSGNTRDQEEWPS